MNSYPPLHFGEGMGVRRIMGPELSKIMIDTLYIVILFQRLDTL